MAGVAMIAFIFSKVFAGYKEHQFEVQGVEWFSFISSTQTYFTFTKIP